MKKPLESRQIVIQVGPKITPEGNKLYRIRCATCQNVRPTISQIVTEKLTAQGRKLLSVEYDTGLQCDAPPNLNYVASDGSIAKPPSGQEVKPRTFCDLWRPRPRRINP